MKRKREERETKREKGGESECAIENSQRHRIIILKKRNDI